MIEKKRVGCEQTRRKVQKRNQKKESTNFARPFSSPHLITRDILRHQNDLDSFHSCEERRKEKKGQAALADQHISSLPSPLFAIQLKES